MKTCKKCKLFWHYKVEKCPVCAMATEEVVENRFTVEAATEIFVPSIENPNVPYFSLLLRDSLGHLHVRKTTKRYSVGDVFEESSGKDYTIGVVGTGIMGAGIVEVCAEAGFDVIWKSRSADALNNAISGLWKNHSETSRSTMTSRIKPTVRFSDLSAADIIIECVPENMELKKSTLREIEEHAKDALIATNTSSLSVNELSAVLNKPERFIGLHFFNPVKKMALVEVVLSKKTGTDTLEKCLEIVGETGKMPIVVRDSPLFIVNRILFPYLTEAVKILLEGHAKADDIDKAAMAGLNNPIGPLALIDLIGLDVFLSILKNKNVRYADEGVVSLIEDMIADGKLGRKSGEGFYKYR